MRSWKTALAVSIITVLASPLAYASSLQIAPVTVEMPATSATSSLYLKNTSSTPLKAQIRVFRWSQVNGEDKLEPATGIVASPPMATVPANKEFTVRLVRTSKEPVAAEETYRIIVDQLPDNTTGAAKLGVSMAFRFSIPVFVLSPKATKPALTWSYGKRNGKTYITAVNDGDRRVRVSELKIGSAKSKQVTLAPGLAGYVLARSSMSWVAPSSVQTGSAPLLITAQGDQGAINAEASASAAR